MAQLQDLNVHAAGVSQRLMETPLYSRTIDPVVDRGESKLRVLEGE